MMNKICCFAGHRDIINSEKVYKELINLIEEMITTKNVLEFWVGNYGTFDLLSARAVRELKIKYPDIQLNLVIPYITNSVNLRKDEFDNIIMADIKEKTPKNLKILKCNEYMINNSQYLICYVAHTWGGAYKTLLYAKNKNKNIYNLC